MDERSPQELAATDARSRWPPTLAFLVVICLGGSALAYKFYAEQREPNQVLMRQHVISKLSDEQIREIHGRSQALLDQMKANADTDANEFWARYADVQTKCRNDVAYRTRNPQACSLPLFWQEIGKLPSGYSTVEEVFEVELMGVCAFVRTIRDAKQHDCLPK